MSTLPTYAKSIQDIATITRKLFKWEESHFRHKMQMQHTLQPPTSKDKSPVLLWFTHSLHDKESTDPRGLFLGTLGFCLSVRPQRPRLYLRQELQGPQLHPQQELQQPQQWSRQLQVLRQLFQQQQLFRRRQLFRQQQLFRRRQLFQWQQLSQQQRKLRLQ